MTGPVAVSGALLGCAGWSVSSQAAAHFPAEGSHLERYAQRFPAVEINSSFYRSHRPQTYARWAAAVPAHFRFSVKMPRTISHDGRLENRDSALSQFIEEVAMLGDKLGCVLVQLPPSLAFDAQRAAACFTTLKELDCMIACEGRHPSWFDSNATALLSANGVTRVQADPPAGQPGPFTATTEAAYIRLHGSPKVYYSSYSDKQLAALARQLQADAARATAWCIFDNTASGAAIVNALSTLRLLSSEQPISLWKERSDAVAVPTARRGTVLQATEENLLDLNFAK